MRRVKGNHGLQACVKKLLCFETTNWVNRPCYNLPDMRLFMHMFHMSKQHFHRSICSYHGDLVWSKLRSILQTFVEQVNSSLKALYLNKIYGSFEGRMRWGLLNFVNDKNGCVAKACAKKMILIRRKNLFLKWVGEPSRYSATHVTVACITIATWHCCKPSANGSAAFKWKLRSHWPKGFATASDLCRNTGPMSSSNRHLEHWSKGAT